MSDRTHRLFGATHDEDLRAAGFDLGPCAQLLVDGDGCLAGANQAARSMFGLTPGEIGRPLHELGLAPGLQLRSHIDTAQAEARPLIIHDVEVNGRAEGAIFDVVVAPVPRTEAAANGTCVSFVEPGARAPLHDLLEQSRLDLESARRELRSTIEELEAMNKTLVSTNEDFETLTDELRQRTDALDDADHLLESLLDHLPWAAVVLDADGRIEVWNRRARALWGPRAHVARGSLLTELDMGLPVDPLLESLRAAWSGAEPPELAVDGVDQRGRPAVWRVRARPLRSGDDKVTKVLLLVQGD